MKKILMLGAAALLLSVAGANASSFPSKSFIVKLDNMADTFIITQSGQLYADVHYFGPQTNSGAQTASAGVGMEAQTGYVGRGIILTDVQENGAKFVCYNFSFPSQNSHRVLHGEWYAYYSYDGKHVEPAGWGTYTATPRLTP